MTTDNINFDEIPWSIAEGVHDGSPIIIRFRNFDSDFPRANYPMRLNVFWTFSTPSEHGMPSSSESAEAQLFEDRLIEAVETDHSAILSVVLTGKGKREFVFHTTDTGEFLRKLSEMPQESERYPIDIDADEDGVWSYVDRVVGDIKK